MCGCVCVCVGGGRGGGHGSPVPHSLVLLALLSVIFDLLGLVSHSCLLFYKYQNKKAFKEELLCSCVGLCESSYFVVFILLFI